MVHRLSSHLCVAVDRFAKVKPESEPSQESGGGTDGGSADADDADGQLGQLKKQWPFYPDLKLLRLALDIARLLRNCCAGSPAFQDAFAESPALPLVRCPCAVPTRVHCPGSLTHTRTHTRMCFCAAGVLDVVPFHSFASWLTLHISWTKVEKLGMSTCLVPIYRVPTPPRNLGTRVWHPLVLSHGTRGTRCCCFALICSAVAVWRRVVLQVLGNACSGDHGACQHVVWAQCFPSRFGVRCWTSFQPGGGFDVADVCMWRGVFVPL